MATTLATRSTSDNSLGALRLAMADAALATGMKGSDTFEQFLIVAIPRLKHFLQGLMRRGLYGRARVLADDFLAIVEDMPVEDVEAVLHPATISDAAEECAESAYRLHRDAMSRRRLIADKEKEVSDGLRLIRALKAEEIRERAGALH